ncbi:DUF659 family protein [Mycena indigotica]|uniref:DUF659 family protein n=1 Tax=Mycena indigotica TaxID=2126181 RepID=A0A8H6S5X5_9AGAR|nr:DUF659 family protein [Mycena indigotica]KAF7293705.1 DUF659 family protein [Mycena indigotica]
MHLPEYIASNILRRSSGNLLVAAESAEGGSDAQPAETGDADLRRKMPAYEVVGRFLVERLKAELNARPNLKGSKGFSHYSDRKAVIAALRSQLEGFTRQQAPFNRPNPAWTRAYLYWQALLDEPAAFVLAHMALKMFAIMPTSMPEERTVSVFTKLSTKDRNRQDAATTVAITQVRQHVRRRDSERKAPVQPRLNWRSIKSEFFSREQSPSPLAPSSAPSEGSTSTEPTTAINLTLDSNLTPGTGSEPGNDAAAAGLNALNARTLATDLLADIIPSLESTRFESEDIADLGDALFRDLLSDAPLLSAETVTNPGVVGTMKGKEKAVDAVFDDDINDEVF